MRKRVVIIGMGVVIFFGIGVENFWKLIKEGKFGISRIERVDVLDLLVKVGVEIKNFDLSNFMDKKEVRRMDRFV